MKLRSSLALLVVGLASGIALVVACSDDAPPNADAAVCDCPAAEPPLQGRIITNQMQTNIPAGLQSVAGGTCPDGAILLGGGCRLETVDLNVLLIEAGSERMNPSTPAYLCRWASTSATARTGIAEAICLMPAP